MCLQIGQGGTYIVIIKTSKGTTGYLGDGM